MPHQLANTSVPNQIQQQGGLGGALGQLLGHLPQIAGLFAPAAAAPLSAAQAILGATEQAGAGAQAGQSVGGAVQDATGKVGGANPPSQVTSEQVAGTGSNSEQGQPSNSGGGAQQGGGGSSEEGASPSQPPAAQSTDPLQAGQAGPPIAKAPLSPEQHQTLSAIQQQFPQLFSMIKANPGMGAGLQNFVNTVEEYQGGAAPPPQDASA